MDSTRRKTSGRFRRGLSPLLLVPIVLLSLTAGASTSQPADSITQWFAQLNDADGDVRDRAAENLMGLTRGQLRELRDVVAAAGPLSPGQNSALREIVTHVFISSADYQLEREDAPFVGLSWTRSDMVPAQGVIVERRVPGFSAYRMLRDGDVIVGIKELPGVQFDNQQLFIASIRSFRSGQTVHFEVQRAGKTIRVPIELKQKPFALRLEGASLDTWIEDMQLQADAYWEKHFAPATNPAITTGAQPQPPVGARREESVNQPLLGS